MKRGYFDGRWHEVDDEDLSNARTSGTVGILSIIGDGLASVGVGTRYEDIVLTDEGGKKVIHAREAGGGDRLKIVYDDNLVELYWDECILICERGHPQPFRLEEPPKVGP